MAVDETGTQPQGNILRDLFKELEGNLKRFNILDSNALLEFLRAAHPEVNEAEPVPPVDNAHVAEGAEQFPEPQEENTEPDPTTPVLDVTGVQS